MSNKNKVIWSEGMFLRPQHFQQQDRYFESYIEGRTGASFAYGWGLTKLRIDNELLRLGKISVIEAQGVMPDGTPFSIPDNEPPPAIIDIPVNTRDEIIYLCLPLRRPGVRESVRKGEEQTQARFISQSGEIRDNASDSNEIAAIETGNMALCLKPESDDRNGYACLGVTRVLERLTDKPIKLDNEYIPPILDCHLSPVTSGYFEEISGLLRQRGNALGHRLCDSGRAGSAEIADYLLLQVINRYEPLFIELSRQKRLHPIELYKEMLQLAGELATFTRSEKRAEQFPAFDFEALGSAFGAVFSSLRQSLSMVLEQTAIPMELAKRKFGIYVSPVSDRSLITGGTFVLAVKADIPGDTLRSNFPAQAKVAPVEVIRELISASMPGIMLRPLPVAPRQIPYHAGFAYFELEKQGKAWDSMNKSGGFAVHLGAEFPGLNMELWAIRD
ncbi:type VI secretion system baseplate subunit TssK [Sansalvadorimonas sp. 2012CJ34-2]|uniref:Type VI secretion system baseplate subunit TssK n=1 Tax=Parendozoicomonas callyspongiae TaxID=2942213 RepID=A0ABT0PD84_9GAMM|nr:type VI secretion system baseplate subunit TssK [Sansalvadorimonas sp. 2012CJ34-2]MCL6269344.1 type VI secretion system baseplate subunit TssK [Sansalvadorimonas sp. 2012CJ34-2]